MGTAARSGSGAFLVARKRKWPRKQGHFPSSERLRSVATAHMPDHDLVATPFADRHVATTPFSIPISPIPVATISPIVIVATLVATITLTAVWSNPQVNLHHRAFLFHRDTSAPC